MKEDLPMISCQNHPGSQIELVNLNQNVPKGERLYCLDGCKWISAPKSLKVFLSDWNGKCSKIKSILIKEKEKYVESSSFIHKKIKALIGEIQNHLTQLLQEVVDMTNQGIQKYEQKLQELDHIPYDKISRDRLVQMIENFIKPEEEFLSIQTQPIQDWQQKCYDSIKAIQASLSVEKETIIDYELIDKFYSKPIRTMAFNHSGDIMIAGCEKQIKVYDFKEGKLKEQVVLEGHPGLVVALCYSKFNDFFISGGKTYDEIKDTSLRLWVKEGHLWVNTQILENHTHSIQQVLLDQQERQMISCDDGNNIMVWGQSGIENKWNHLQTLQDHTGYVYSISLNQANTFLVSTSYDQSVKIWKKQENNLWNIFQSLQFEEFGYRIVFINNQSFLWQGLKSEGLSLFKFMEQDQTFQKCNYIPLSQGTSCYWRFPSIFNETLRILVTKHHKQIYIFKVEEKDGNINLTKLQEIPFKSHYIYGQLSHNGNYLLAYDEASVKLQVFKMQLRVAQVVEI